MIEFEPKSIQQAIERIKRENANISGDIMKQAISRALNHTAQKAKTQANQNIRKTYNISAAKLNSELKVRYSQARTLEARVVASGQPLSWNNFEAKQIGDKSTTSFNRKGVASSRLNRKSRNNAAKGVTAIIKKGEAVNLATAFIQVANGGITVFARGKYKSKGEGFEFGDERMPIGKITTTSIPLMFINDEVMKPTLTSAVNILGDRIQHEITWLLGK